MYKNKPVWAYFCIGFGILNLMDWAKRRRIVIGIIVSFVIAGFAGVFSFVLITNPATCFDGEQNGIEDGIDCGGACELLCAFQADPAFVLFAQYIENDGRPDVIAHISNQNSNADIRNAVYTLEVFTNDGDLIVTRKGSLDIPSQTTKAIFIQQVLPFTSKGARAFITISSQEYYQRKESPVISAESFTWSRLGAQPTLEVQINGDVEKDLRRIPVIVTVFDAENKVIGASRTVLNSIKNNTQEEIIFTWQNPFSAPPARTIFTFEIS